MSDIEETFEVNTGRYSYYMVITTHINALGKPSSYGVDFGGKMKGCVSITVEDINDVPEVYKDYPQILKTFKDRKKIAFISHIGFNQKCSVKTELLKSNGTRHMVRTALTQVKNRFNWVERFHFVDASEVDCKEGLVVSLFALSILTNKQSYYEKYFKAYLENDQVRMDYKKCLSLLDSSEAKRNTSFATFLVACKLVDKAVIDVISPIYAESKTIMEFFVSLRSIYGKGFCEFVHPWGLTFVFNHILQNRSFASERWIIDYASVPNINVNVEDWRNATVKQKNKLDFVREEFRKAYLDKQMGGGRHYIGSYDELEL